MQTLIDGIVITEDNKEAFETMLGITQAHEEPKNLFIYGPSGSGKSATAFARSYEKDLLSTRKVVTTHPGELAIALTVMLERSEDFLMRVGETDVLFIDAFDDAFLPNNIEVAPEAVQLLANARMNCTDKVKDTIILARKPKTEYANEDLGNILDKFTEIEVKPLSNTADRAEMIRRVITRMNEKKESRGITLSDEAIAFMATDEAGTIPYTYHATEAILESKEFDEGTVISIGMLKEILK